MERRITELLELAERIVRERRVPTEAERARFLALKADLATATAPWRDRFADLADRFASVLEGIGL